MDKKKNLSYTNINSRLSAERKTYNLRKKVKQEIKENKEIADFCLINQLNDDCLSSIFKWLPIVERIKSERVCKKWQTVSKLSWATCKSLDLLEDTWGLGERPKGKFKKLNVKILRQVLTRCGFYLESIEIKNSDILKHDLSKSALSVIARLCPNIKIIDIKDVSISNSGILSLSKKCSNIEKLCLGHCNDLNDTDLGNLLVNNKSLKSLKLFSLEMSGNSLLNLPFDTIEEIVFDNCTGAYCKNLIKILPQFKKLITLEIIISDSDINFLFGKHDNVKDSLVVGACKNLNVLNLSNVAYDPDITQNLLSESFISNLKNLTKLNISENPSITDDFLKSICQNCKQLLSINVSSCSSITDVGLAAITTLPKLEILYVNDIINITGEKFRCFPHLKSLECRSCIRVQDIDLITLLEVSPNMHHLDVSDCIKLTNNFIELAIEIKENNQNCTLTIYIQLTKITREVNTPYLKVQKNNPNYSLIKILGNHFERDLLRRLGNPILMNELPDSSDDDFDLDVYNESDDNYDDFNNYNYYDSDDDDNGFFPDLDHWF